MSTPKNPPPQSLQARQGLLAGLGLLLLAAGLGHWAWQSASPTVRADSRYRVTAASITLTEQPDWIRSDVKLEALGHSGLLDTSSQGGLSILDPPERLEERVATALRFHPWVQQVGQITKSSPNRLTVEVEYRRPLATVTGGRSTASRRALIPIDRAGVLLPASDLSEQDLGYLPRIEASQLLRATGATPPRVGESWNDPRIAGALEIISRLGPVWHTLPLLDISPSPTPEVRGNQRYYVYELRSTGNTRIAWGSAPSQSPPDESPFEAKLARLESYTAQHGPLDSVSGSPAWIDVRNGIVTRPRLVQRDDPEAPKTAKREQETTSK